MQFSESDSGSHFQFDLNGVFGNKVRNNQLIIFGICLINGFMHLNWQILIEFINVKLVIYFENQTNNTHNFSTHLKV